MARKLSLLKDTTPSSNRIIRLEQMMQCVYFFYILEGGYSVKISAYYHKLVSNYRVSNILEEEHHLISYVVCNKAICKAALATRDMIITHTKVKSFNSLPLPPHSFNYSP